MKPESAEKVIEVMKSEKSNALVKELACMRLQSLSEDDGMPRC